MVTWNIDEIVIQVIDNLNVILAGMRDQRFCLFQAGNRIALTQQNIRAKAKQTRQNRSPSHLCHRWTLGDRRAASGEYTRTV